MHIYYCVMAYNEELLLFRTVKRLRTKDTTFIIHIQKSVDMSSFTKNLWGKDVFFIPNGERIDTIWGDITCVKASVKMFEYAKRFHEKYRPKEPAYCVLMSGSDYPLKSNEYIETYFSRNYPKSFFGWCDSFEEWKNGKSLLSNALKSYWFSFPNTKLKIQIKPFRYILPRCFKNTNVSLKIIFSVMLQICMTWGGVMKKFFSRKQIPNLKFGCSETWIQLSMPSICSLLIYLRSHPNYINEFGTYVHNPEEILLQTVLKNIEPENCIGKMLVDTTARQIHRGSLNLSNNDLAFIKDIMSKPDSLFARKFSSSTEELLNFIDREIER